MQEQHIVTKETLLGLLSQVEALSRLHMATTKPEKVEQLRRFLSKVLGHQYDDYIPLLYDPKPEPDCPNARRVSNLKAHSGREHILTKNETDKRTTVFAADTNFFVLDDGQWNHWKKFARNGNVFSEQHIISVYESMLDMFVVRKGKDKLISVCWEISLSGKNGKDHTWSELLHIWAKPVPKDLFDIYFAEALKNGLFYSSNTHMGIIEMLIESGCIVDYSVVPYTKEGYSDEVKKKNKRNPDNFDREQIVLDILSTVPNAMLLL